MFKQSSFEQELQESMAKNLTSNQAEERHGFKKMARVTEYLNAAASIFEQAGMTQTADDIIEVMQNLAGALK